MMTIEVENEETILCIKECSKRLNAKVTNLLQEKSEAPDASNESSVMNESEHSDKRFDFLHKTSNNLPRQCNKDFSKFRWSETSNTN